MSKKNKQAQHTIIATVPQIYVVQATLGNRGTTLYAGDEVLANVFDTHVLASLLERGILVQKAEEQQEAEESQPQEKEQQEDDSKASPAQATEIEQQESAAGEATFEDLGLVDGTEA